MTGRPESFGVAVDGGVITVARWGNGPRVVLGIHGVAMSSAAFAAIARRLPAAFTLLAPDLRGRGAGVRLPGPYGLRRHADDCAAIIRAVGAPMVVLGASMGASVGNVLGGRYPDLVERLVALDMGAPIPLPPGMTREEFRAVVLGPSLTRLRMTFASRAEYLAFFSMHPALSEDWTEEVQGYLLADLTGSEPRLKPNIVAEAVEHDSVDQIAPAPDLTASLAKIACPVHLIRAPRNLLNEPQPLVSEEMLALWRSQTPQLTDEIAPDCNHYTLIFGARGAQLVADRLAELIAAPSTS